MDVRKDVYDFFSEELDVFFGYSNQNFLNPMLEMMQTEKREMYLMPTTQRRIISALAQLTLGDPIPLKKLAAICRTHKTKISQELYILEEKGYVSVEMSCLDRRMKLVQITPKGKAMHDECDQRAVQILREFSRLFCTDEQMAEYLSCLRRLNELWKGMEPEHFCDIKSS